MDETRTEKPRRRPIVAFAVGLFVVGLLVRVLFVVDAYYPHFSALSIYAGLAGAQLILLGIWAGLANIRTAWRVLGVVSGLLLVRNVTIFDSVHVWHLIHVEDWTPLVISYIGLAAPVISTWLTMSITSAMYSRIKHVSDISSDTAIPSDTAGLWQFDIRHVLLAITFCAVLFIPSQGARMSYATSPVIRAAAYPVFGFVLAIGCALIALTSVTACLAIRRVKWRLFIAVATGIVVATLPLLILPLGPEGMTFYMNANLIGTLTVLAALWVVRRCGYRLVSAKTPRAAGQRLSVAVTVLIVAGVVARFLFSLRDHAPGIHLLSIYCGLLIAQAMLLGLWGGLSGWPPGRRVAMVFVGMLFLWSVFTMEMWNDLNFDACLAIWALFCIPTASIVLCALWVRHTKARLCLFADRRYPQASDTLQFGIRQMLVATAVTAVLMTGGMSMKSFFENRPGHSIFPVLAVFALVLGLAYPLTAVVALWATLGLNRPAPRLLLVAAVALTAALLPLMFVPFDMDGGTVYVASCLLQTVVVVAVLLVARSAGYRLVPLRLTGVASPPAPDPPRAPP